MRYYLNKYTNLGYVFKFNEAYLSNNYLYYGKYNNINYLMWFRVCPRNSTYSLM